MQRSVKAMVTTVALAAAFTAVPMYTPAAYAENVTCQSGFVGNGEGTGDMKVAVHLKINAYTDCYNVDGGYIGAGTRVYYQCYVVNNYGNKWWLVRVAGSSTSGWTYDGNISPVWNDENGNGKIDYLHCTQLF
jgi:hypothetical protein